MMWDGIAFALLASFAVYVKSSVLRRASIITWWTDGVYIACEVVSVHSTSRHETSSHAAITAKLCVVTNTSSALLKSPAPSLVAPQMLHPETSPTSSRADRHNHSTAA